MIKQPTRTTSHSKTLIDIFCSNNTATISDIIVEQSSIGDHDIIGLKQKDPYSEIQTAENIYKGLFKIQPTALKSDLKTSAGPPIYRTKI